MIHKPRYVIFYHDGHYWAAHKSIIMMSHGTSLEMALKRAREVKRHYEETEEILDD